jgi:hypothetical protein
MNGMKGAHAKAKQFRALYMVIDTSSIGTQQLPVASKVGQWRTDSEGCILTQTCLLSVHTGTGIRRMDGTRMNMPSCRPNSLRRLHPSGCVYVLFCMCFVRGCT